VSAIRLAPHSLFKEMKLFEEKNPYTPGSKTVCFVNPDNPSEVLEFEPP
jgi:hypothetical protein